MEAKKNKNRMRQGQGDDNGLLFGKCMHLELYIVLPLFYFNKDD